MTASLTRQHNSQEDEEKEIPASLHKDKYPLSARHTRSLVDSLSYKRQHEDIKATAPDPPRLPKIEKRRGWLRETRPRLVLAQPHNAKDRQLNLREVCTMLMPRSSVQYQNELYVNTLQSCVIMSRVSDHYVSAAY